MLNKLTTYNNGLPGILGLSKENIQFNIDLHDPNYFLPVFSFKYTGLFSNENL